MEIIQCLKYKLLAYYCLIVVYIVSIWFTIIQFIKSHKVAKITNEDERVALVTGGGTGIGFETANKLLKAGMTVIILGIETDQRNGVIHLRQMYGNHVKFLECDLASLKSVRRAGDAFRAMNLPLHVLINNAGIMFAPRAETKDGFEHHWVINYLSHFLLTRLLLKTLIESASRARPSRIVNLSSCLHYPGTINFEDTQGKTFYSAEAAYTQSKLAMVLFSNALAKRLEGQDIPVLVNSVHPAVAFSGLYKHVWFNKLIPGITKKILQTPEMGSDTVVHVATSDQVTRGGDYYDNCQIRVPSKEAQSIEVARKLWELSCEQTRIKNYDIKHIMT